MNINLMSSKISFREFLYGFLLIMTSGNPIFISSKPLLVIILGLLVLRLNLERDADFIKKFLYFTAFSFSIFFLQFLYWGSMPLSFVFGYFVRIGVGGILFYKLRNRLPLVLWKVTVFCSLIAFPFYLIHLFSGNIFNLHSVIFYTFRPLHFGEQVLRNSGFGWEPGVFQIYINLVFFLNLNRLSQFNWKEILILILSLITTFSTTGYVTFFVIIVVYLYSSKDVLLRKWRKLVPVAFILTIISFGYIYFNSDFLHLKLKNQIESTEDFDGSFSQNRFMTFLFDFKYIKMNPILGNGYNFDMRYTKDDKRKLLSFMRRKDKTNLGAGNGLSDMVARYGLLYSILFFSLFYKRLYNLSTKMRLSFIIIILLFLWGEPMMNHPFFMALPLIYLKN